MTKTILEQRPALKHLMDIVQQSGRALRRLMAEARTLLGSLKDRFFKLSDGSEYTLTRGDRTKMGYPWALQTREDAEVMQTVPLNIMPAPITIVAQPEVVATEVVAPSNVTTMERRLRRFEQQVLTPGEKAAWPTMDATARQELRRVLAERIAKAA